MAQIGWSRLFFLAYGFIVLGDVFCDPVHDVLTGKSHTLETGIKENITLIVWKFEKDGKVTKLVEWDQDGEFWYSRKGRAAISSVNGDLTLSNMMKDESGLYKGYIEVNGAVKNFVFNVELMGVLLIGLGIALVYRKIRRMKAAVQGPLKLPDMIEVVGRAVSTQTVTVRHKGPSSRR